MSKIVAIIGILLIMAIMPVSGSIDIRSGLAQAYSSVSVGDVVGIATSYSGSEGYGGSLSAGAEGTTTGDETNIIGWSEGNGEDLYLGSGVYIQAYNDVYATGEGAIEADEVEAGAESTSGIGDNYNFADVNIFVNGIGDANGFTWASAWQ